ncbi:MAG: hypothetical protein J7599_12430 [Niabella sp.]|nr:hypothetical protein [Niabella sp.]
MKKLILLSCFLAKLSFCQAQTTASDVSPFPADVFTYDGISMYHYGLKWASDSWKAGGATAWFGGYAGIKLFSGGAPRMVVTSTGNVGIGTTSPGFKLTVYEPTVNNTYMYVGNSSVQTFMGAGGAYMGIAGTATNHDFAIYTGLAEKMRIAANGNVGIGTSAPADKLSVNGRIRAKEIRVETANWPDYVFRPSYRLMSLSQIERFITTHGHLPEVPSAKEVAEKGIEVGANQAVLLKKIEELTLHLIEQEKRQAAQRKQINELLKRIDALEGALDVSAVKH